MHIPIFRFTWGVMVGWLLVTVGLSQSQANSEVGTTGFAFLKITTDARAAGMGEAVNAILEGGMLAPWNSTSLAHLTRHQITTALVKFPHDIQFGYIGYSWSSGHRFNLVAGVQYANFGQFRKTSLTDPAGANGQIFRAGGFSSGLALAFMPDSILTLWAGAKYLYESLAGNQADALALDVGFRFLIPSIEGLVAGIVVHNIGSPLHDFFPGQTAPLPRSIHLGFRYPPRHLPLVLAAEFSKARDQGAVLRLGGEFDLGGRVFLRGGFSSLGLELRTGREIDDLAGFSAGLGVRIRRHRLDYAISPYPAFGQIHRITLVVQF